MSPHWLSELAPPPPHLELCRCCPRFLFLSRSGFGPCKLSYWYLHFTFGKRAVKVEKMCTLNDNPNAWTSLFKGLCTCMKRPRPSRHSKLSAHQSYCNQEILKQLKLVCHYEKQWNGMELALTESISKTFGISKDHVVCVQYGHRGYWSNVIQFLLEIQLNF